MSSADEESQNRIELARKTLQDIDREYGSDAVFTSSFGAEDMVIAHMISDLGLSIEVATIDTGRLHQDTYDLMDKATQRYGLKINAYFPDKGAVEEMVSHKGMNLFYYSQENRKMCCNIRKVEPLGRILDGKKAWVTGLRSSQNKFREGMNRIEEDRSRGVVKANPIIDWDSDDVWSYIRKNDVPYNRLHDQGFPSIGCEPCTRAIRPGEDERAGRWWWESDLKECGLHVPENSQAIPSGKTGTHGGAN